METDRAVAIKRVLISVSDKSGLIPLACELYEHHGAELVSTGGTAGFLRKAGFTVTDVATVTSFPEILDGRVKTLHPAIHAGILYKRNDAGHVQTVQKLGIGGFDMVVVNLYPFQETIAKPGVTLAEAIEQIDIGGPAMVRSAAKNHEFVVVIVDPEDYSDIIAELDRNGGNISSERRQALAAKAFRHTAAYDLAIARYISGGRYEGFIGEEVRKLAYAENRWQGDAFLYKLPGADDDPLAHHKFTQIAGAPSGFINETDLYRLTQTITHIAAGFKLNFGYVPAICVGVKHGNACGAAQSAGDMTAVTGMVNGDPEAIFGGYVMTNRHVTLHYAEVLRTLNVQGDKPRPLDGVIAPGIDAEAVEMLKRKDERCRIFINPALRGTFAIHELDRSKLFRQVRNGFLVQGAYDFVLKLDDPSIEKINTSGRVEDDSLWKDLILAWAVGCTSNSNTITLASDGMVMANAVSQQSRIAAVFLAKLKAERANIVTQGCVAYSDSFFPFDDAVKLLHSMRVRAILTSKAGVRFEDVGRYCIENGIILYAAPDAMIRGFFGH